MSKVKLLLLGLLAVLAASAVASASASATQFFSGGNLITGTLTILSIQTGNQVLKATLGGVKVTVTCTGVHGTGSVENVSGMGLGLILALYTGCTVSGAGTGGCLVSNGGDIHVHSHVLATGTTAAPLLTFSPESGETFVEITFDSCVEQIELNKAFAVTGSANANVHNTTGEAEFTAATTENLKFGGNKASLTGKSKVEMVGGGLITVE